MFALLLAAALPAAADAASSTSFPDVRLRGPDGAIAATRVERVTVPGAGRRVIEATVRGGPWDGARLHLAEAGPARRGVLDAGPGGRWRVREDAGGGHDLFVEAIPKTPAGGCAGGLRAPEDTPRDHDDHGGGIAGGLACDDGSVIDLLIVYTPAARIAAGGVAAITAEIDLAVAFTNGAYTASGVPLAVNLVHVEEVAYDENGTYDDHAFRLRDPDDGVMDGVHDLRNTHGADLVSLVVADPEFCGAAFVMRDVSPGFADDAFSVVTWFCAAANLSLAHEIGHNLGCEHDRADGTPPGAFDFSYGHRFTGNGGNLWRTILATEPGDRIQRFSNPNVLFDGQPTGVAAGNPSSADNAQTLIATAPVAANFRCDPAICDGVSPPGDTEDCNANGLPDQCEIILGFAEDVNGNDVPDDCEVPSNDRCGTAQLVLPGVIPFSTEVATTEGFAEPGCGGFERDVWFIAVLNCPDDVVTIRTCGTSFDSQLAVYAAPCPLAPGEAVACTDAGCGDDAEVTFTATPGAYFIRVGSADGSVGAGTLEILCGGPPSCPADFDDDGLVGTADLLGLLAAWNTNDPLYDFAPDGGDGVVAIEDLLALLIAWGPCP